MTGYGILQHRTAVITGATGRAGREITKQLLLAGARLLLVGSNEEKLVQFRRELSATEAQVHTLAVDLRQPQAAGEVLRTALDIFGQVDILVHLVGGWIGGIEIPEITVADLETMLNQHLWTTFHLAQVFAPRFRDNGWGRIIVVSSPNAVLTPAKMGAYNIGKAAQEALIGTLAQELKGSKVTANVLRVRTIEMEKGIETQPSARGTTPLEIASAVLFLCSDLADMVNGACIPLYGDA